MSRADRIKEEIGLLKLALAALLAIDVSLIAWLAQHYATANHALVLVGGAATLTATAGAFWAGHLAYRRIEQSEGL